MGRHQPRLRELLLAAASSLVLAGASAGWVGHIEPSGAAESTTAASLGKAAAAVNVSSLSPCRWSPHAHKKVCLGLLGAGGGRDNEMEEPPPSNHGETAQTSPPSNDRAIVATKATVKAAVAWQRSRHDNSNSTHHAAAAAAAAAAAGSAASALHAAMTVDSGGGGDNCTGIARKDGTSVLPSDDTPVPRANAAAAARWWRCVVPPALAASPPTPGRATLVFVHVPKVGGSSLEHAFEKLTELRKPLCARRFMDSFARRPAAVHSARSVSGCDPKASNLLWGHLSLDLEGAERLVGRPGVRPKVYAMVFLRQPFARLVSFAVYMGVSRADFETSWGKQMAANTQTSMVNGLTPLGVLNRNRFSGEPLSCARDMGNAVAEAKKRLATTFTLVGVTEAYAASLWLAARAFGWGEAVVMGSLTAPVAGFRTAGAEKRKVAPFTAADVAPSARADVEAKEACDVAVHAFGEQLVRSRLLAMAAPDRQAFKDFERRYEAARKIHDH